MRTKMCANIVVNPDAEIQNSAAIKNVIQSTSAQHLTTLQAETAARRQADVDKRWKQREQEQRESGGAATEVYAYVCVYADACGFVGGGGWGQSRVVVSFADIQPCTLLRHTHCDRKWRLRPHFITQDAAERERREEQEVAEALRRIEEKRSLQGAEEEEVPAAAPAATSHAAQGQSVAERRGRFAEAGVDAEVVHGQLESALLHEVREENPMAAVRRLGVTPL